MSICPEEPRLDGKLVLVTGGSGGIGLETCKGLAQRGAEVVILARNLSKAKQAIQAIKMVTDSDIHFISLDLSDLENVSAASDEIINRWPNRTIDVVVANAGIWPTRYSQSTQGFEIAFAINVLGHHALIRRLYNSSKLSIGTRIVMLTGDIYILANDCTPDFKYRKKNSGQLAYCRSKLGNLWCVGELSRRYKDIDSYAVHPGTIASDLGGKVGGFANLLKRIMLLPTEEGAQTSLFCATQPNLISGGYYHNTMGKMNLRQEDPASNTEKAAAFWEILEKLVANYIE
jgi:NAD(P)-dependent dehydrogenase (short-subunit alcohol dehydrogenase family)